jgi:hypothetical protein
MKINMKNVVNPKCKSCDKVASFNYKDSVIPEYCYIHSSEDMINIVSKRCEKEDCNIIIKSNNKYDGYCKTCFVKDNPDEKIINNRCMKEYAVRDYIKEHFSDYKWIFDKSLKNGCSKYRPDIFLDLETHIIIIEIDEYQHAIYDSHNEELRVQYIHDYCDNRKLVFIRFNPDTYRDKNNHIIKSPWVYYRTKLKISSDKKLERDWNDRLESLKNTINKFIQIIPEKDIEFIKLFYNDF